MPHSAQPAELAAHAAGRAPPAERSAQHSDPAGPATAATGQRVLVIDDNEVVRRSLHAVLTSRGYRAVDAANGVQALQALRTACEPFDAVILDHHMPGMDGREVLAALRASHPELPVLMASGDDLCGLHLAADAHLRFVQKAHGPRALLAELSGLLSASA